MVYSLLITSCNRDDLLKRTIQSFMEYCDEQPREIVIVEDGPERPMPDFLKPYQHRGLKWLCNGRRMGQIFSCDRLWKECSNEIAFWCEEDWQFQESGFIRKSQAILDKHPEVVMVSLRGDTGWHPLVNDRRFPFKIAEPGWRGGWGGFAFNPGLRRKADYKRIGSYGKITGYGTHGLGHEMDLSKLYASLGYVIADLGSPIITHIGGGRSRAVEPVEVEVPRVLIAIKAGHKLQYGRWESAESPLFDKATAWKGEAYGTDIHISVPENPRIEAVRATWWKDVAKYPNVTARFCYGKAPDSRQPLEDEIFLPCEDDYEHLPQKTIAICKWALKEGYDYAFLCDDDTFVYVDRLVAELMSNRFAYAGWAQGEVCAGGVGYWLNRQAMAAVQDNPSGWAEDVWVGRCMSYAGIEATNLPNHMPGFGDHWFMPNGFDPKKIEDLYVVTAHAVQPEVMRDWYAHLMEGTNAKELS